jgi:hypothetical protein
MMPDTATRVPEQTADEINERIRENTRLNVAMYSQSSPEVIDQRLRELDEEWDIERTLELNAATLATTSILFGLVGKKRWLLLAGTVTAFLAQHAVQGWCPPVPIFRRLGFRTLREIDQERNALKALRGDFDGLDAQESPVSLEQVDAAMDAVER